MFFFKDIKILGVPIYCKDSQLTDRVNVISNKQEDDEENIDYLLDKDKTELVILGDSFTQGYLSDGRYANPNMSTIIANELGLNLHNYGVNASGYTLANSFQTQANNAAADTSYDHSKVKYVLVIGGINDANAPGYPDCSVASKLLVSTLSQTFANAIIVLIPNWGGVALDFNHSKVFRSICNIENNYDNVTYLYDNLSVLIGYYNLMGADNVHPTQDGYYVLAKSIVAKLHGGSLPRSKVVNITPGNGWDTSNLNVYRDETSLRVYGYITATTDIGVSNMTIATLDPSSGCVGAGGYIECIATNLKSYPIDIEPGVSLIGYEQNGLIELQNDRGNTITAGTSIAINFNLPILIY